VHVGDAGWKQPLRDLAATRFPDASSARCRCAFAKRFRTPSEKNGDATPRALLARRPKPFLLRRSKAEVEADLPSKNKDVEVFRLRHEPLLGRGRLSLRLMASDELVGDVVQVIADDLRLGADSQNIVADAFDQRGSPARRDGAERVPCVACDAAEFEAVARAFFAATRHSFFKRRHDPPDVSGLIGRLR
jgi:hypothetical protein